MRCSDKAWLALGAGVVAYEIAAPRGELLSEGVDRYLSRRPWTTHAVVVGLALHLLNLLPERLDPLNRLAAAFGR
ncbi:hypothetical protein FGG44_gp37 [Mycobacterium phage MacnCheese]|uniref:Uncharacterized protein n=1 Tax=Mycobacterium phage MacnCheese TaxID=2927982 RepID=I6XD12_9CAUD|nr:hypothetical protein FGG44_gp37 [Mycobacterium phage MacnCheese]AFN37731.1 hypothetical protein MACNCHEESE_37 [Mycobacterium phage MacnCheese]